MHNGMAPFKVNLYSWGWRDSFQKFLTNSITWKSQTHVTSWTNMFMGNSEYCILHRLWYDLYTELNKPICLLVCEK